MVNSWKMAKMTIKTNFHDNLAPFSQRKEAKLLNAKVAKCQSRRGGLRQGVRGGGGGHKRKQGLYESHTYTGTPWPGWVSAREGGGGVLALALRLATWQLCRQVLNE